MLGERFREHFAEHTLRRERGGSERVITNVVMMGMGEPLQNYAALVPALRMMLDDHGYGLSRRRVTLSTSGVVPMIDRLAVSFVVMRRAGRRSRKLKLRRGKRRLRLRLTKYPSARRWPQERRKAGPRFSRNAPPAIP